MCKAMINGTGNLYAELFQVFISLNELLLVIHLEAEVVQAGIAATLGCGNQNLAVLVDAVRLRNLNQPKVMVSIAVAHESSSDCGFLEDFNKAAGLRIE